MGFKFSKHEPAKVERHDLYVLQYQLVSFLSKSFLRNLVSKQRRRMLVGGYDLDMSYITDRVLAMSFPAERMRAMYRNPLWQVKSVLEMRHQGHYKVFNLCTEQAYDSCHFFGRVERFPFDDNHVPPLQMIKEFCECVHSWLSADPKNIAVVHCMAGKGRTGLMVSSYLVYTGMSAEDALQVYADKRTLNNEGVSIPSQRRYVSYWEKVISFPDKVNCGPPNVNLPKPRSRELRRIRLYDMVNIEAVFFVVSELQEIPGERYFPHAEVSKNCCRRVKKSSQRTNNHCYFYSFVEEDEEEEEEGGKNSPDHQAKEPHLVVQMDTESSAFYQRPCLEFYYEEPIRVTGDVRVIFYEKMIGGRLFYACFNTSFIKNSLLQLTLQELDKVGKKGRSICGPEFCLELLFAPANADGLLPTPSQEKIEAMLGV